jgi:hypothetical protein
MVCTDIPVHDYFEWGGCSFKRSNVRRSGGTLGSDAPLLNHRFYRFGLNNLF